MEHPIVLYMRRKGIKQQAEFARLVGLSPQYVNDIVKRGARLGRNGAQKIQDATGGVLTIQELLSWEPDRSQLREKVEAADRAAGFPLEADPLEEPEPLDPEPDDADPAPADLYARAIAKRDEREAAKKKRGSAA